jgi:hypothetical protein
MAEDAVMKRSHLWEKWKMAGLSHENMINTCLELVHPHVIAVWVMAWDLVVTLPLKLTRFQPRVIDSAFMMGQTKLESGHMTKWFKFGTLSKHGEKAGYSDISGSQ